MYINKSATPAYIAAVGMIEKYIRQYIESGELRDRFNAFDKEEVPWGTGFDISTILGATKYASKQAEHGDYDPNAFTLRFNTKTYGQYAVTLDPQKVNECIDSDAKSAEYAAQITESLYQGWTRDKNVAVSGECTKLIAKSALSGVEITLGADVDTWAIDFLTAVKTAVEDIREGIQGTAYGNTQVGSGYIAARDVVIVMSNATSASLDSHGYAKVFTPEYLDAANVTRITSNKIADNVALVTDARNIQVRRKYEKFVGPIENSDGSQNFFYNKEEYIEAAIDADSGLVAFPFKVIKTSEG